MQEAYFDNIRSRIIPLLQNAYKEVIIAMAWFTSQELFSELIECLKRGVRVELILLDSPINFMEYAPDFNELIKSGGTFYIASSELGLMHHKFCVIDSKIVITGSYNWTYYAETRNVENILITDDLKIVDGFTDEFHRLQGRIPEINEAPRYTWNEMEVMANLNIVDINYEAEHISHLYHRPPVKVVETYTQVLTTQIKHTPKSAYYIGLAAVDPKVRDDESIKFKVLIHKNVILPFTSEEQVLYFNSVENSELFVQIIYGIKNDIADSLLQEVDLNDIISGSACDNFRLVYRMTLDVNGEIRFDASCTETGKRWTITLLNPKFVKYE